MTRYRLIVLALVVAFLAIAAPAAMAEPLRWDVTVPGFTQIQLPRSINYCTTHIVRSTYSPNGTAPYNVPGDNYSNGWRDVRFAWWQGFDGYILRRNLIDAHYNGQLPPPFPSTTESFSIAACRWGVREDLLRAVAVQESDWHEHGTPGDMCLPQHPDPNSGYGSYGIMQVKHFSCSTDNTGQGSWGGFPRTWNSIPFNLEVYGAAFRACLEWSLWYTIPIGDNNATIERGCVGAWFYGHYQPVDPDTQTYVSSVYTHLANMDWLNY